MIESVKYDILKLFLVFIILLLCNEILKLNKAFYIKSNTYMSLTFILCEFSGEMSVSLNKFIFC